MNSKPASSLSPVTAPTRSARVCVWAACLLAAAVALLRFLLARPVHFCGTPDACFYLGLAQTLSSEHRFQTRFLYDFQQLHPTLPNTGLEYWRPGVSLLLLALKPFGAVTLHASIVLTTLVGILLAAAAWHIAARAYADRRLALGSFALCLFLSPVWIGSASPDSSLYYGAAVAWFLALFSVHRQGLWQDLLALLCVCFAYLIRNDAALLIVPFLAVLWARWQEHRKRPQLQEAKQSDWPYALLLVAGFLLALAPMHLLYKGVLGTAFPSGTAQTIFLNDLSDFGRYRDPATLHTLLTHGARHLILFRIATLATILYRVPALMIGYPALIFLPGLFLRRDQEHLRGQVTYGNGDSVLQNLPDLRGPGTFALTVLLVYSFILPAIGGFSALRTAVGLMPLASVLVVVAIFRTARTARLAVWLIGGVVTANAIAGLMELRRDLGAANLIGDADRGEAAQLAALGADPARAVVLTGDPVQFSVTTGYSTVALPSNGLDAIAAAARDFHATHVILDSDHLPSSLAALEQQLQPVHSVTLPKEHGLILELPETATHP